MTKAVVVDPDEDVRMNSALRQKAGECRRLCHEMIGTVLEKNRQLGALVTEIKNDPETYETGAVERLSAAIGMSPETLYKAMSFNIAYTEAQYKALMKRRNPGGAPLTWSHVIYLLGIADTDTRTLWEKRAAEEGWSAKELSKQLQAAFGKKRIGSGRGFIKPKTIREGLRNCEAAMTDLNKRFDEVFEGVFSSAAEIPPDQYDLDTLKYLRTSKKAGARLLQHLSEQQTAAVRLEKHMVECLKKRGLATKDDEEEEAA